MTIREWLDSQVGQFDHIIQLCYNLFMKIINIISKKHGSFKIKLDNDDYENLKDKSLYINKVGHYFYIRINPKKLFLHRWLVNCPKNKCVDHKNRNTLDNRKSNLRIVSIQENLRNQKRANNKTGYTGVALYQNGKFTAQIKHNYKKIHLGVFDTIKDAYEARRKAERLYWGLK